MSGEGHEEEELNVILVVHWLYNVSASADKQDVDTKITQVANLCIFHCTQDVVRRQD